VQYDRVLKVVSTKSEEQTDDEWPIAKLSDALFSGSMDIRTFTGTLRDMGIFEDREPQEVRDLRQLAATHEESAEYREARAVLNRVLALVPDDAEASDALKRVESELSNQEVEALRQQARGHVARRDYPEARLRLQRILEITPDDADASATLAQVEEELKSQDFEDLKARANQHLVNRELSEARALLGKVLEVTPDDAQARALLAQIDTGLTVQQLRTEAEEHVANRRYAGAKPILVRILDLVPGDANAARSLAEVEFQLQSKERCFSEIDLAISPERARGRRGSYQVTITNQGDVPVGCVLSGEDPEGTCRFDFQPNEVKVEPGASVGVSLVVNPTRKPRIGGTRIHKFRVKATPQPGEAGEIKTIAGQLECIPLLLRWALTVAGAAAVAAVAVNRSLQRWGLTSVKKLLLAVVSAVIAGLVIWWLAGPYGPLEGDPTGTIRVGSNPSGASFTLVGEGEVYYRATTDWVVSDAPPGLYTIYWDNRPGFTTPGPVIARLEPGVVLRFVGNYLESPTSER
jgi:tetratricopeptide (TPR) repeat protein